MQQGVDQYKQGRHDQAQKNLELAETVFPENYAVPYYLGLIYLEQGKRTAAIAQWRQYVQMDPRSENAVRIRKNLTVLLREEARESARTAVANEASLIRMPAADNTVAITAFKNLGSENIKPLGKGMAALLIHDLSLVPDLQVVERVKVQALLQEMKLGTSGLVATETAPRVGKLLRAKHVTSGSLADLEKENLQIASAMVDADQVSNIGTQEAQGELKKFYDLEKQIACQIIEDLDRSCDDVPPAFHEIHTKSLAALIFFAVGLDYLDREKYDQARDAFQKSLEKDPSFELAEQSLLDTPVQGMQYKAGSEGTADGMIAMAASNGVSATAAGTAIAVGTALSPEVSGGVGIVPVVGIVAGAAAVAGVAVAAGGSSSSSSPDTNGTDTSGDSDGTVTSRDVSISVIDINAVQDDFYDLFVNGVFIGPVNNPPGGTTTYNVTLNSGSNTIELRLTVIQCCDTYLQININSGEFVQDFSSIDGVPSIFTWIINAP